MQPVKTVAIATLGCKVNQFESAAFASGFVAAGCELVPFSSPADICVINTCAVTARAGQQSRQLIRRARRTNPDARLVITGCQAQIAASEILEISSSPVCLIGNGNKHLLVERALAASRCDLEMLMSDIGRKKEVCPLEVHRFPERTRAFLRIQDGCNNFCSYCIVPFTRGRSRSVPLADILGQTALFIEEGYRELVVTGINTGKYGLDLDEGQTLCSLLDLLSASFPDLRIRLSSLEPTEVDERLLQLLTRRKNLMPHLHIPLQSGDDETLRRMNRRYGAEQYRQAVALVHRALPHAAIGCDVLAGFPGESEAAHQVTCSLLQELPLSYLHVFPYSRRPGTRAAELAGQLPKVEKEKRVASLRKLGLRKRRTFHQRFIGTRQQVLVERRTGEGLLQGFSENYLPVFFPGPASLLQTVVSVRIENIVDDQVHGSLEIPDGSG